MHQTAGGDVDLDTMPQEAVAQIRASWQPIRHGPQVAIHGDLGEANVLLTEQQVALIDWDEARVDAAAFDFADIPDEVPVPVNVDRSAVATAGVA